MLTNSNIEDWFVHRFRCEKFERFGDHSPSTYVAGILVARVRNSTKFQPPNRLRRRVDQSQSATAVSARSSFRLQIFVGDFVDPE